MSLSTPVVRRSRLPLPATLLLAALALLSPPEVHAQQETGAITGVVVDSETGETLPGASVLVVGTQNGASTGVDGRYRLRGIAPGTYDVEYSFVSYQSKTVTGLQVEAGETTTLDVALQSATQELEEVVVTAEVARNSEAGLLRQRQRAAAVSDAISAEAISESGSSNAADAMEKVTGASVTGGKYVSVRGLGGRYVNTTLNGAELPTTDPDENAVPLDLFPSAMLERIVTSKTFTPDRAGSFTGGSIDIGTIAFPGEFNLTFSSSVGYNTAAEYGASRFGYAQGLNEIPEVAALGVPVIGSRRAPEFAERAQQVDAMTDAFSTNLVPQSGNVPIDQSYDLSFSNEFSVLGDRPIGVVATASYNQNVGGYTGGLTARTPLSSPTNDVLDEGRFRLDNDETSSVEDLYSGLLNLSARPFENHEIGANVLYTRSEERVGQVQEGTEATEFLSGDIFRTRVVRKAIRTVRSVQGRGDHRFGQGLVEGLFGTSGERLRLEWNGALNYTEQDEPDYRQFANELNADGSFAGINVSAYSEPTRYFRNMEQDGLSGDASLAVPIAGAEFKFGGSYADKSRSFRQRRFVYQINGGLDYDENPAYFFGDLGGIIGTDAQGRPELGNIIQESTEGRNNYNGDQTITAGFAMVDVPFGSVLQKLGAGSVPVLSNLRLIGGARYERTDQSIDVYEATLSYPLRDEDFAAGPRIEEGDWLPSLNLVYSISDQMNVRGAYGRTLARPSFREFSSSCFTLFIAGYQLCGANYRSAANSSGNRVNNLNRTLVDNFDLRWEWFTRAGEILAVSGFYKNFEDAIVRTFVPVNNPTLTFANAPSATVYGLELEARQRLDALGGPDWLQRFEVGGNLSLVHSSSEVPIENSMGDLVLVNRPLQGQSPYLINANASYENPELGTSAALYYNVFGRRLSEITRDAALIESAAEAPDRYEQPRHTIDLTVSQSFRPVGLRSLELRLKAKNLLDEDFVVAREYRGRVYPVTRYELGRSFSLGLEYAF